MKRPIQVDRDPLAARLRQEMEQTLARVMAAVNAAADGRLIEAAGLPLRQLKSFIFQGIAAFRSRTGNRWFTKPVLCQLS